MEVPLTEAHWESVYLPEHPLIMLARGWERQLDTRYDALFYRPKLTPAAYRSWLSQNAVSYVALPDVRLDSAGEQEGQLVSRGLSYLVEVWRSAHWRLFAVRDATPLAQPPAVLSGVGPDSFTLLAPRPGAFTVRVHFTPYWTIERGPASVHRAPGGWTQIETRLEPASSASASTCSRRRLVEAAVGAAPRNGTPLTRPGPRLRAEAGRARSL